jgi:hypothetical protein
MPDPEPNLKYKHLIEFARGVAKISGSQSLESILQSIDFAPPEVQAEHIDRLLEVLGSLAVAGHEAGQAEPDDTDTDPDFKDWWEVEQHNTVPEGLHSVLARRAWDACAASTQSRHERHNLETVGVLRGVLYEVLFKFEKYASDIDPDLINEIKRVLEQTKEGSELPEQPHYRMFTNWLSKEIERFCDSGMASAHEFAGMAVARFQPEMMPRSYGRRSGKYSPENISKASEGCPPANGPPEFLAFLQGHPMWSWLQAQASQLAWKEARWFYTGVPRDDEP